MLNIQEYQVTYNALEDIGERIARQLDLHNNKAWSHYLQSFDIADNNVIYNIDAIGPYSAEDYEYITIAFTDIENFNVEEWFKEYLEMIERNKAEKAQEQAQEQAMIKEQNIKDSIIMAKNLLEEHGYLVLDNQARQLCNVVLK
jgi:hypothetical protein